MKKITNYATGYFSYCFSQNQLLGKYTQSVNFGTSLGKPKLND